MNEQNTRAELIDPQLKAAGWGVVEGSRIYREYPIKLGEIKAGGMRAGTLKADYVLIYKNRKLAAVEAKSDALDVSEGVAQAKLYAQKLQLSTAYVANGKAIYQMCLQTGRESNVSAFPSPDDLWHKTFGDRNAWREKFDAVAIDAMGGRKSTRYYQEVAINKAMAAIADDKKRILLTLATGTGKTFIASQIAWKLFKSRWTLQKGGKRTPRILFLTDRNILANQAYLDFGSFSEDARIRINPDGIRKWGDVPTNASVFFTIFQTFMSGPNGTPYFGAYPNDFFDFIIIDECHRGGANDESTWRDILEYFNPAVQLGLTATPKRQDNVDTYAYFGEPVYKYSLKEGIQDGFLTPFKIMCIETTLDEYIYARDDEVVAGEVQEDKVYKEKDFNKLIEIEARERKRVQLMLTNINPAEKTLVFCANQAHAAKIRDLINQESASTKPDYCVRVTADDGDIGERYLRQFQDNEKTIPTILTTSRKLSTGVDALNIRNIVLMRLVNSMLEFKQIIGRGTRLFDGKHYFTIVDFVGAYHHFSDPEWDGLPTVVVEPDTPDVVGAPRIKPDSSDNPADPEKPTAMVKIELADGKERLIQSMLSTKYPLAGKLVDVKEFLQNMFTIFQLPNLFGNEAKLRELWSDPMTRRKLLERLEQAGCSKSDLLNLQKLINAKDSDLIDVLGYISYVRKPISRQKRVADAKDRIYIYLKKEQREFIDFVLKSYIKGGVDELDDSKLDKLIVLKYNSILDATEALGDLGNIRTVFIGFQKYLYLEKAG